MYEIESLTLKQKKERPIITLRSDILLDQPCILDTVIDGEIVTVRTSPVRLVHSFPDGHLRIVTDNTVYSHYMPY